jgi:hypothetical protein
MLCKLIMYDFNNFSGPLLLGGARSGQRPEHLFTGPAHRALVFIVEIFPTGAFCNLPLFAALIWIVDVAAIGSLALVHLFRLGHGSLPSQGLSFYLQIIPNKYFRAALQRCQTPDRTASPTPQNNHE